MKEFFDNELFDSIKRFFEAVSEKFRNIREPGKPLIIKGFIAIMLALTTLSVGMIILEREENNPQVTTTLAPEGVSSTTAEALTMPDRSQLKTNILFGLDSAEDDVHLLFVLSLDSETGESRIFFLEPTAICKVNEIEGSLIYHLTNGGVSQLVLAVSEYTGLEIDRYLVGDEKAFISFIKYLGDIEIDVKDSISYTHDGLSYIIDKGAQVMTADMLLKYVVYLCDDTETYAENLRVLFAQLAKLLFDCEDSQKAQDNFGNVIGCFETNISALDFSENKHAVMNLAHELMLKLEAYNSLAEFKGLGTPQQ